MVAGWLAGIAALAGTAVGVLAPAAAAGSCTASSGVRVVVDAGALGGVSVRCAAGDPASGLAALGAAGFSWSDVPRQPGFVCTIGGRPDPCNGAPQDAYWSYWHADAGGGWTYSPLGAGNRDPRPGTVEGWAFGAGRPPAVAPPAVDAPPAPAPAPAPEPPARQPAPEAAPAAPAAPAPPSADDGPAPAAPGGGASSGGAEGDAPDAGDAPAATTGPASPAPDTSAASGATASAGPAATDAATADPSATPTTDAAAGGPGDDLGAQAPAADDDGGSPAGPIAAGVLVAALAGGAGWQAWRRRRGAAVLDLSPDRQT